jgi:hypothetical protein
MLEYLNGVGLLLHDAGMVPLEGSGTGSTPRFNESPPMHRSARRISRRPVLC